MLKQLFAVTALVSGALAAAPLMSGALAATPLVPDSLFAALRPAAPQSLVLAGEADAVTPLAGRVLAFDDRMGSVLVASAPDGLYEAVGAASSVAGSVTVGDVYYAVAVDEVFVALAPVTVGEDDEVIRLGRADNVGELTSCVRRCELAVRSALG